MPHRFYAIVAAVAAISLTGGSLTAAETGNAGAQKPTPRRIISGIERSVPPERKAEETVEPHPVVELREGVQGLEWAPQSPEVEATETLHYKASDTLFRRGVWQFQFSFRPLRMIRVDLPQPDGKMRRKIIWYMVYRITNPGQHMTPHEGEESREQQFAAWHQGLYSIERVDKAGQMLASAGPHMFVPVFSLRSREENLKKEWLDQLVPLAKEAIYRREQPPVPLEEFYNTVEIANHQYKENPADKEKKLGIPVTTPQVDKSVWGYVTWVGGDPPQPAANEIDPRMDRFSICIWGLTNAYQWQDTPGAFKPGDPPATGRKLQQKVLQLNFTRTGDEFLQREEEIRLGIEGQVDWEWVYR